MHSIILYPPVLLANVIAWYLYYDKPCWVHANSNPLGLNLTFTRVQVVSTLTGSTIDNPIYLTDDEGTHIYIG